MSEAEKLARRLAEQVGYKTGYPPLLPLCSALLQAREALEPLMPNVAGPGYQMHPNVERGIVAALAAIDALLRRKER